MSSIDDHRAIRRVLAMLLEPGDDMVDTHEMFKTFCRLGQAMSITDLQARLNVARGKHNKAMVDNKPESRRARRCQYMQFSWTSLIHDIAFAFVEDVCKLRAAHSLLVFKTNDDSAMLVAIQLLMPYFPCLMKHKGGIIIKTCP